MSEKVIDMETGELVDKVDENALVLKEALDLSIDFDRYEELAEQSKIIKAQIEEWENEYDKKIIELLRRNNAKSLKTKYQTYTIVEEQKNVQRLDTKTLKEKEPEIYNKYSVFSDRKEYLKKTERKY